MESSFSLSLLTHAHTHSHRVVLCDLSRLTHITAKTDNLLILQIHCSQSESNNSSHIQPAELRTGIKNSF